MDRRLVLGLGGTVDYELTWDSAVLERLALEHRLRRHELTTTAPITDERSLLVAILAFVASGVGAERLVSSSEAVTGFASHFDFTVTLGGTGVRAGLVLDRLGIPSTQHLVSIDDNVRRLLPASMSYVSSATHDTLDPHLIVQYPAGARIRLVDGEVISPSPNRLIFANDPPNREMKLSDDLPDALASAPVFLVSGFNTMTDRELLDTRLTELLDAMRSLPDDALVYYEDAGFYDRTFAATVRERLLARIDVYGMNEDELQEYLGRTISLLDASEVVRALDDIRTIIPAPVIVVHTRYWAIAIGADAGRHRAALESAVRAAATRYRLGDDFTADDAERTSGMARHRGGEAVVRAVESAVTGAVGVAAHALDVLHPTTVGLGDTFVGGFLAASFSRAEEAAEASPSGAAR
ncbi:ADP-dependent glucokinase/phosphofructokinase [Microbacterium hydrocarbonoxydans]|uniref:ADP-dependent glucokinase/phosphofructokinase n=1 Tax=Microbacterium hydrocarbonoxydans TaxID=273678 RepID=UPI001269B1A9|nr:ADP-dependent glucokinase/phosphofructokinase [Microbacterium hydrocarbonoxydans]